MNQQSMVPTSTPFLFDRNEVRTAIGADGEAWFCAKDVYEALGIEWKGAAGSLKNMPESWQGVCYLQTPSGVHEAIFIAEPGVYQSAFRSRKPNAVEFTEWVCGEVLPALRRQGYYGEVKHKDRLAYSRHILMLTQRIGREHDTFVRTILLNELREMCRLTGQRLPDQALIGRFTGLLP